MKKRILFLFLMLCYTIHPSPNLSLFKKSLFLLSKTFLFFKQKPLKSSFIILAIFILTKLFFRKHIFTPKYFQKLSLISKTMPAEPQDEEEKKLKLLLKEIEDVKNITEEIIKKCKKETFYCTSEYYIFTSFFNFILKDPLLNKWENTLKEYFSKNSSEKMPSEMHNILPRFFQGNLNNFSTALKVIKDFCTCKERLSKDLNELDALIRISSLEEHVLFRKSLESLKKWFNEINLSPPTFFIQKET